MARCEAVAATDIIPASDIAAGDLLNVAPGAGGSQTLTLTFSGGTVSLWIDDGRMMLGDQEVLEAFSPITTDLDTFS